MRLCKQQCNRAVSLWAPSHVCFNDDICEITKRNENKTTQVFGLRKFQRNKSKTEMWAVENLINVKAASFAFSLWQVILAVPPADADADADGDADADNAMPPP